MVRILLVVHLLLALAMVGAILLQRSEGSTLGIGGGGTGFMTGRQAGNLLTRITALLATIFMITSLTLAVLGGYDPHAPRRSILDQADNQEGKSATAVVPAPTPMSATVPPSTLSVLPPPPSAPATANRPDTTRTQATGREQRTQEREDR
ncbi:Preprotein translocase subunit SecG (TC 3.A.5.1.1) [invertebrate metagenome]|uniref:Preprotein translocase subunit SecG (TC 3.A.5.1.1) n=1 Tax=invertebrate metagenome TaxID=1711999 RepID=A0A484H4I5_9ZZZZ